MHGLRGFGRQCQPALPERPAGSDAGKIPPRLVDIKSDKFSSVVDNIINAITPADYEAAKQYVSNPEEYDFHKILNWK